MVLVRSSLFLIWFAWIGCVSHAIHPQPPLPSFPLASDEATRILYAISGNGSLGLEDRGKAAIKFACEYPEDPRGARMLREQMGESDFVVRADALFLLGAFPTEDNVKTLESYLGNRISEIHYAALDGLRLADTPRANAAVQESLLWKFSNIAKGPTRILQGVTLLFPMLVFANYATFDLMYSANPTFPSPVQNKEPLSLWTIPFAGPIFALWASSTAFIYWIGDGLLFQTALGLGNILTLGYLDRGEPWSIEEWSAGGATSSGRSSLAMVSRLVTLRADCGRENSELGRLFFP